MYVQQFLDGIGHDILLVHNRCIIPSIRSALCLNAPASSTDFPSRIGCLNPFLWWVYQNPAVQALLMCGSLGTLESLPGCWYFMIFDCSIFLLAFYLSICIYMHIYTTFNNKGATNKLWWCDQHHVTSDGMQLDQKTSSLRSSSFGPTDWPPLKWFVSSLGLKVWCRLKMSGQ